MPPCYLKRSPLFVLKRAANARKAGRDQATTFAFWFRQKYSLPPNDPRYLSMLPEEIEADYWAHHFSENPATDSSEDESYNTDDLVDAMNNGEWESVINE